MKSGIDDTLAPFLPHLLAQKWRLAAAYSMTLAGVLLTLALPWPMKFLIDGVLTGESRLPGLETLPIGAQVLCLSALMALLSLSAALTLAAEKIRHARIRERFGLDLRDQLIRHIYRLSIFSRQAELSGELTMRLVSDSQLVSRLLCKTAALALRDGGLAVFILLATFWIDIRMGLVVSAMAMLLAVIVRRYAPALTRAARMKRLREGEVAALTQESIAGIEHIQAMALEDQSRMRYLHHSTRSLGAGVGEVRAAVRMERAAQIFSGLAIAAVAGAGGLLVVRGQLSLGALTVCVAYVTQLLKPIEKLNETASNIARGLVRAERLVELLRARTAIPETHDGRQASPIREIRCANVFYRFPDAEYPTISGFSHTFRIGECTALTGPSGVGKSTILKLVLRLIDPDAGTIEADGIRYAAIDPSSLRSKFAVLMQSAHLFSGSVREVLRELRPDANDHDILNALDSVHLSGLLSQLPEGLDTRLDEAGGRLSGGQRARLLLARTLVSGRPVIMLDEPFANIDRKSKNVILKALRGVKARRVLIVVSHDEMLLQIADHVISLECRQPFRELRRAVAD